MIENECTIECRMSGNFPWFPGKLALKLIEGWCHFLLLASTQSLSHDIILSAGVPVLMNFKEMNARAIKYLHVHAMHGFVLLVFLFVCCLVFVYFLNKLKFLFVVVHS